MAAKADLKSHYILYLKSLKTNPKLKVKDYCDQYGLVFNSARRYIKRPKAGEDVEALIADLELEIAAKPVSKPKPKKRPAKIKTKIEAASERERGRKLKHDWHELLKDFLTLAAVNPSLTITEYAKEKGINPASARRQFNSMRDRDEFRSLFDLFEEKRAILQAARSDKKSTKTGESITSFQGRNARANEKLRNATEKRQMNRDQKQISDQKIAQVQAGIVDPLPNAVIHGGYCKSAGILADVIEALAEIDPMSVQNELLMARARYARMSSEITRRIALLDLYEETGDIPLDNDGEPINIERERDKLLFGYGDKLAGLEFSIANMAKNETKRFNDVKKLYLDQLMMPDVLPAQQQRIVMEMLDNRIRQNWSALETIQWIERLGATAPAGLLAEARHELATAEPEIIEDGVTDDELDTLTAEYQSRQSIQLNEWLPARRAEVAERIKQAEDKENGLETELSPQEIIQNAATEQAYDDLDEFTEGFADLDGFEVLDGKTNKERNK